MKTGQTFVFIFLPSDFTFKLKIQRIANDFQGLHGPSMYAKAHICWDRHSFRPFVLPHIHSITQ